jgi:hypothetical protein
VGGKRLLLLPLLAFKRSIFCMAYFFMDRISERMMDDGYNEGIMLGNEEKLLTVDNSKCPRQRYGREW